MELYQILEDKWANYIETDYAITVNNGTNGLMLALASLDIGPGDNVIVPEFSMIATAFAVSYLGATITAVDCDDTLNIDPNLIEEAIVPETKAIIITHIYGRPADMDKIMEIANRHDLPVIEDACEAHGATYKGKRVGSIGTIGVFSFFKNKIIQCEEGGILTTNRKDLYEKMNRLKNLYFTDKHDYFHPKVAWNMRLANSLANMVLAQLPNIEMAIQKRKLIADELDKLLRKHIAPRARPPGSVVWVYDIIGNYSNDYMVDELTKRGVRARHFFKPMSMQPMYKSDYTDLKAYKYSQIGYYIAIDHNMKEEEVLEIAKNIIDIYES